MDSPSLAEPILISNCSQMIPVLRQHDVTHQISATPHQEK
jgi:hypothetical protein